MFAEMPLAFAMEENEHCSYAPVSLSVTCTVNKELLRKAVQGNMVH